jgi:hypothetical protein
VQAKLETFFGDPAQVAKYSQLTPAKSAFYRPVGHKNHRQGNRHHQLALGFFL